MDASNSRSSRSRLSSSRARSHSSRARSASRITTPQRIAAAASADGRAAGSTTSIAPTASSSAREYKPGGVAVSSRSNRPSTICDATVSGFEPPNGGFSAATWYITHPKLHTSALWSYGSCLIISGHEYGIVPTAAAPPPLASARFFSSPSFTVSPDDKGFSSSAVASPKSTSLTRRASRSTKMLFGVMSRCTTPASSCT